MPFLHSPFALTFGLIFVAELGDKTLLATLLLATRYPQWPVLLGAWLGFAAQTGIALAGGALFSQLSPVLIRWVTVAVFALFGIQLLRSKDEDDAADDHPGRSPFAITFLTVFAAEWGDATQLGTMALVGRFGSPIQVGLGALFGLWAGAAIAVFLGRKVGNRVQPRTLRRIGGGLFLCFAALTAIQGG